MLTCSSTVRLFYFAGGAEGVMSHGLSQAHKCKSQACTHKHMSTHVQVFLLYIFRTVSVSLQIHNCNYKVYYLARVEFDGMTAGMFGSAIETRNWAVRSGMK